MQVTGELKRFNLIPIKKAVVDLRRGLILRTYYVNPNKFMEKVIQQKLKKSAVYIGKLASPISEALKTKNIFKLKDYFQSEQVLSTFVRRNVEVTASDFISTYHSKQIAGYNLLNFVTTLNKQYLSQFKKSLKDVGIIYQVNIDEKIKKAKRIKTKVKVKEQTIKNQLTDSSIFENALQYDGAVIRRKATLLSRNYPVVTGRFVSRLISLLNPSTIKVEALFNSLLGTSLTDNKDIAKNIKLPVYYYLSDKKLFSSILTNLIIDSEKKLREGSENVDIGCLYHNYIMLALVDKSSFLSLTSTYNRECIQRFAVAKGTFEDRYNELKNTCPDLIEPLILVYPDITQVVNYISGIVTDNTKGYYLSLLGARSDVTPNMLANIYGMLYRDTDFEKMLSHWYYYLIGERPVIDIDDVLYQIVTAKLLNVSYIPFTVIDDVVPTYSHFAFTPIPKIAKIQQLMMARIKEGISKLKKVDDIRTVYIPVTKILPQQTTIAYRLLPLQPVYLKDDMIPFNGNVKDAIPVTVNGYLMIEDNSEPFVVITPHNIIRS